MNPFSKDNPSPQTCEVSQPDGPGIGRISMGEMPCGTVGNKIRTAAGEVVHLLDEQVEVLFRNMNQLEERLVPYLTPDFPRPSPEKEKQPQEASPMLEWAGEKGRTLRGINERMRHLTSRIQS